MSDWGVYNEDYEGTEPLFEISDGDPEADVESNAEVRTNGKQCRAWMATIFDYSERFLEGLQQAEWTGLCYQEEKGEATGRNHIQLFIWFKRKKRFNGVKDWFKRIYEEAKLPEGGRTIHIEACRNPREAYEYCKKEDTRTGNFRFEGGRFPAGKEEKEIDQVVLAIQDGKGLSEIAREFPKTFLRYSIGIPKLIQHFQSVPEYFKVRCIFISGQAGTGKSAFVRAWCSEHKKSLFTLDVQSGQQVWWDGYTNQEAILLDDFDSSLIPLKMMNRILDIYRMTLQVKSSTVQRNWTDVFITTNNEIGNWYANYFADERDAFIRRVDKIFNITTPYASSQIDISNVPYREYQQITLLN